MSTVAEESFVTGEEVTTTTSTRVTTTLYDLMAAMQTAVEPEDDACIVALITHWMRTGRLTFLGDRRGASHDRIAFHATTSQPLS